MVTVLLNDKYNLIRRLRNGIKRLRAVEGSQYLFTDLNSQVTSQVTSI